MLVALSALALQASLASAQDLDGPPAPPAARDAVFAPPVRLRAGGELLGEGRHFPSPSSLDFDGDGLPDLVIGDLSGEVTRHERQPNGELGPPQGVRTKDGGRLDFFNW